MSKQSERMYGNSPKLERDESGEVKVKKSKEKAPEGGEANGGAEGIPVLVKHSMERAELHHKHEKEHHMHDLGKEHSDKKALHEKHEREFEELHERHEKELGAKK